MDLDDVDGDDKGNPNQHVRGVYYKYPQAIRNYARDDRFDEFLFKKAYRPAREFNACKRRETPTRDSKDPFSASSSNQFFINQNPLFQIKKDTLRIWLRYPTAAHEKRQWQGNARRSRTKSALALKRCASRRIC
jgi:hypothetical protein